MTLGLLPRAACLIVAIIVAAGPLGAQSELDELLSLPLSPGALALLSVEAQDPRAADRLADGPRDDRASVRAAAGIELMRVVAGFGGPRKPRLFSMPRRASMSSPLRP